jgi:hypothetical protein
MRSTMLAMALILALGPEAAADEPATLHRKSYVESKSDQVFAAFLMFMTAHEFEQQQDRLGQARERDQLQLVPGGVPSMRAGAMGVALLGAAVVLAAHVPDRLRVIVNGPVHVGPAMFEEGGMGAGVGGRF